MLNLNPQEEILNHLRKDSILYEAITQLKIEIRPELNIDIYHSLLASIVSQQLSTKVVKVIWKRFTDLFIDGYPDATSLLSKEHEVLRGIGLSNSKANYVKNVAEFKLANDMSFDFLQTMSDEEIKKSEDASKKGKKDKVLATEDYQLHEALLLLKGLTIFNRS